MFLAIVNAGITIVTTIDGFEYREGELDITKLTMSIMRICLAHDESKKKSKHIAELWAQRRKTPKPIRLCPQWISVKGDKYVLNEKAKTVRRIFQLAIDGMGMKLIAREVGWPWTTVGNCLHNRVTIGEYQAQKFIDDTRKRVKAGEPIKGIFPAVVDSEPSTPRFSIEQRKRHGGGRAAAWVNLFTGLLYNVVDGSPLWVVDKGNGRRFVSSAAVGTIPEQCGISS